jgi:hypothetical protein
MMPQWCASACPRLPPSAPGAIIEDPALSRGGCVVRTDTSQIDARLESRVTPSSPALGEERAAGAANPARCEEFEP